MRNLIVYCYFFCAIILISCGPSEEEIRKQKYIEQRIEYWKSLNGNLSPTLARKMAEEDWELSKGNTQSTEKGIMEETPGFK